MAGQPPNRPDEEGRKPSGPDESTAPGAAPAAYQPFPESIPAAESLEPDAAPAAPAESGTVGAAVTDIGAAPAPEVTVTVTESSGAAPSSPAPLTESTEGASMVPGAVDPAGQVTTDTPAGSAPPIDAGEALSTTEENEAAALPEIARRQAALDERESELQRREQSAEAARKQLEDLTGQKRQERKTQDRRGSAGSALLAFGILLLALSVVLLLADYATDDSPSPTATPAPSPTVAPQAGGGEDGAAGQALAVAASGLVSSGPAILDWPDNWWLFPSFYLALLALAFIVVGAIVAYRNDALWSEESGFGATLLGAVPVMLTVAAAATIVIYILPIEEARDGSLPTRAERWEDWRSFLAPTLGLLLGGAVGIALALFASDQCKASSANPHLTDELKTRWLALHARIHDWCPPQTTTPPDDWSKAANAACVEADHALHELQRKLGFDSENELASEKGAVGPEWILGTGFVDSWVRLHGAEEALFYVAPKEHLVGQGLVDEMRLKDSRIVNHDDLLFKLRWAVVNLGGADYLTPSPKPPTAPATGQVNESQARAVLRDIRHSINEFRDARRDGLVRARNYLSWTGLLTGVTAYALLGVAILVQVPQEFVVAAVVFYLVGAIVGLFNQLRISATNAGSQAEEDFGLARAQLVYSPVLSGLAAVFGVVITALLYASLTGSVIVYQAPPEPTSTPTPTAGATSGGEAAPAESPAATTEESPAAAAESIAEPSPTAATTAEEDQPLAPLGVASPEELPRLVDIFDLERNRFGLVLAAVFGLVPGLLVDRLQGVANRYKADLSSTSTQQNVTS